MDTTFEDWLRQLAAAGKGPAPIDDMVRGKPWQAGINLPGDWTGATLTGQIRVSPDASGAVLASFTVGALTYDPTGGTSGIGETRWSISLTGTQTAALPTDTDGNGVETFAYMMFLTPSGGTQELLWGGAVNLMGLV
jgi:hypothetical protein